MREQMNGLDELEMGELWSEARRRTPRAQPEPPPPGRSTSSRILAAVVAFAVFIVAGAFAWQALRPGPTTVQAPGDGVSGVELWPERTAPDLAQAQALADSGDPEIAWRLDPKEVATRFAKDVLGWGAPTTGSYTVTFQPDQDPTVDIRTVVLAHIPPPCPSPPPGQQMACPPPYDSETITLRQLGTAGDTGIWSVTDVRASGLRVDLTSGAFVDVGSDVATSTTFPATASAVAEFGASSGYRIGTDDACGFREAQPLREGDRSLTIEFPIGSYAACASPVPSYAWLATSSYPLVQDPFVVDPLNPAGDPTTRHLYGLTLIPFGLSLPAATASPTVTASSASRSAEPSEAATAGPSSSGLVQDGTLECTVTFPSSTLTPGQPTGASFTVRNVTNHDLQVGGPTGSLVFAREGQQLQDSARVQWGMQGPGPALPRTLAPGASMPIRSWDTAVLWSGPLDITPRCDEASLPTLTLDVAAPGAPPDPTTALSVAVRALGSRFAACTPTTSGDWVDGTFPFQPAVAARCGGFVDEQDGFDVVALAAIAPPDAPTVNPAELPTMIEAVPQFDFPNGAKLNLSWWVLVVTGSNATCASHSSVTLTANSEGYVGGGTCHL